MQNKLSVDKKLEYVFEAYERLVALGAWDAKKVVEETERLIDTNYCTTKDLVEFMGKQKNETSLILGVNEITKK